MRQPNRSISVPVIEHLDVNAYGLYPGIDGAGLSIDFEEGLTVVLGANGLGKSTLVLMLYRLLSGPRDIRGIEDRRELGAAQLAVTTLPPHARSTFASRVSDSAEGATASVDFTLGGTPIRVTRALSTLALQHLTVGHDELAASEDEFEAAVLRLSSLGSFGDWILLLRHLVFYFEERRALVWDPAAQGQLLRLLFLPAATAQLWTQQEKEILQLDTQSRNLNAVLTRERRTAERDEIRLESSSQVRAELETLEAMQADDEAAQETLERELAELRTTREDARLRRLLAGQAEESAFREHERAKLLAIGAAFPEESESARYVLAQLLTGAHCLVCGHDVPEVAASYARRVESRECVVCGSALSGEGPEELDRERAARTALALEGASTEMRHAASAFAEAETQYSESLSAFTELGAQIADRAERIETLVASLPPEESVLHERRTQLRALQSRVATMRAQLVVKRQVFSRLVRRTSRSIAGSADRVQEAFTEYSRGFLLEDCSLVWAPQERPVGQSGQTIGFPAFELNLGGSDFAAPVRRSGPDEVSESQREFIDLAFRMALMKVAGQPGASTLVVDAPESSLDAVFTQRAAAVFGRYAGEGNRLLLTSNLVEGSLILELLRTNVPRDEQGSRVVDLLELAEPTAAIRQLRGEYEAVRDRVLDYEDTA